MTVISFLQAAAAETGSLPWAAQCEASQRFGLSLAEVEEAALQSGCLPLRYLRNRETLSLTDQLTVLRARVAVIGCGGLGGYVVEELARLGVGNLVLVDPDVFEEHNLNRQLYSSLALLGRSKVEAARARVNEINPAVSVTAHRTAFCAANSLELLSGCTVVVDALDNQPARRELSQECRALGIPWVHGAIAGWFGQLGVQLPGDDLTPFLGQRAQGRGVETRLGNPSFTPAVIASLQVAQTLKILISQPTQRMLFVNLLHMEFEDPARA